MIRNKKGYDQFTGNEFSSKSWSAKTLTKPDEIQHEISLMHLEGRVIESLKFIGLCYNLRRDDLEDRVYNYYDQIGDLEEEEILHKSDYENIDPLYCFSRFAEIDEPFLIKFADGDCFEIKAPFAASYRFSMNKIPWDIDAGINAPNVEAATLLSPAIGQTISAVEFDIGTKDSHPAYFEDFLVGDLDEYIAGIVLRFEDGLGIRISGNLDFTWVEYIGFDDEPVGIPFKDLETGLFNYEDLHYDPTVDFLSFSPIFYFGEKGADHVGTPFTTFAPSNGKSALYIYNCDLGLFDWAITAATGGYCEFDDYDFDFNEWSSVLSHAETLLGFEAFDDLFEYALLLKSPDGTPNSRLLRYVNCSGVDFWGNRKQYKEQLACMRKWTELVLTEADHMNITSY